MIVLQLLRKYVRNAPDPPATLAAFGSKLRCNRDEIRLKCTRRASIARRTGTSADGSAISSDETLIVIVVNMQRWFEEIAE